MELTERKLHVEERLWRLRGLKGPFIKKNFPHQSSQHQHDTIRDQESAAAVLSDRKSVLDHKISF